MSESIFESFKTDIALPDYAALEFQYQIDPKDSTRSQIVMRTPNRSDKISIARMPNGHWVYQSSHSRYVATAGQWSPLTEQILQQLGNNFPGSQITLAFDNDQPGRKYAWEAKKLLSRSGKSIQVRLPDQKDWNEQLQQKRPHFK